jgi:hypothetical protein
LKGFYNKRNWWRIAVSQQALVPDERIELFLVPLVSKRFFDDLRLKDIAG